MPSTNRRCTSEASAPRFATSPELWTGRRRYSRWSRPLHGRGRRAGVASDRLSRILAESSSEGDGGWSSARLCEVTRDVIGVSGAGVMLMSGEIPRGSLCTTNEVSDLIEELQYTLGEGPCVDAYDQNQVVSESDLTDPARSRWPAFTPQAVAAGVRAVFAFPLQVGIVRLGALDLYRDGPGALTDEQHGDAMAMADLIAQWVL